MSAIVAPNFTENGWSLARAPQSLVDVLRDAIKEGLPQAVEEKEVDVIEGLPPYFIHRRDLTSRVSSSIYLLNLIRIYFNFVFGMNF